MFRILLLILTLNLFAANPFEGTEMFENGHPLDKLLFSIWREQKLLPIRQCSDSVFIRRAYLDTVGLLPPAEKVKQFLKDKSSDKRVKLVRELLNRPEFVDLLTMRLADMLRIKSEFPVNLWPNAVQAWHRKLHDDILANRSWRDMAHEMLTVSGSNFRVPYANFFRASADRSPEGLAKIAALTFMNVRTEKFSASERKNFAAFFSRIRYKTTFEWKEEIVYTDPRKTEVNAEFPGSESFVIDSPRTDPRTVFADWLLNDENPYFARAFVNRVWFWIFGNSFTAEADDMPLLPGFWKRLFGSSDIIAPELLAFLTDSFRRSNYNIKELYRLILTSPAYYAASGDSSREKYFAAYPARRLEAEILIDIISALSNSYDSYSSVIPEPFTFLPRGTRAVTIADGSISTGVLDNFGRPPRDSGLLSERNNNISGSQRLYLMNSGTLYNRAVKIGNSCRGKDHLNRLYLSVLSRYPTAEERKAVSDFYKNSSPSERRLYYPSLAWILLNSREFTYHH